MSRRVRRPLAKSRTSGDRPKGAPPFRNRKPGDRLQGDRPQAARPGSKPPRVSEPRREKALAVAAEPAKAAEQPLPTKVQTVVVTADENNMRVDRFREARVPGLSFAHLQPVVRKGDLRLNRKRADSKDR